MGIDNLKFSEITINNSGLTPINLSSAKLNINFNENVNKTADRTVDFKNLKKKDLINLLKKYGQETDSSNRKKIVNLEIDNTNQSLVINYKNNTKKIVNEDLSYELVEGEIGNSDDPTSQEIRSFFSANNELKRKKVSTSTTTLETTFDLNGKKQQTIEYDKETLRTTLTNFDELEQPQSREIRSGSTIMSYDFKGTDGAQRILAKVQNKGLPIEERETYTYREDGNVEIRLYSASVQNTDNGSEYFSAEVGSIPTGIEGIEAKGSTYKGNTANVTVKYCAPTNFDSSTGTVKNPAELRSSPTTTEVPSPTPTETPTPATTEAPSPTPTETPTPATTEAPSPTPTETPTPAAEAPSPTPTETPIPATTEVPSPTPTEKTADATPKVDTKGQDGGAFHETIEQTVPKTGSSLAPTETPSPAPTLSANSTVKAQPLKTDVTFKEVPKQDETKLSDETVQTKPGTIKLERPVNTLVHRSEDPKNQGIEPEVTTVIHELRVSPQKVEPGNSHITETAVKEQLKNASIQLDNFIKQYSSDLKLPISKIHELLGIPAGQSTTEFFNSIIQNINVGDIQNVTNSLNKLIALLANSDTDMQSIKRTLAPLVKISNPEKEVAKTETQDYIPISDPKVIINVSEFATEIGIRASELSSKISTIHNEESIIVEFNVKVNGEVTPKIYKIEKNLKGEVIVTEVKKNQIQRVSAPAVNAFKDEIVSLLPPELRKHLDKCQTIQDCKNFIETYTKGVTRYTRSESIRPGITNNDLQFTYVFRNDTFYKIPANEAILQEQQAIEELHLNVVADKELFNELNNLMSKGTYINRKGNIVKVKPQNMTVTSANTTDEWILESEPVKISFEEVISKEMEEAIKEITHRYRRRLSNSKHNEITSSAETNKFEIEQNIRNNERLREIMTNIGIPSAQTLAFIASLAYNSSEGLRKIIRNSNDDKSDVRGVEVMNDDAS